MRRIFFVLGFVVIVLPLSVSLPYFPFRQLRVNPCWLLVLYLGFMLELPWGGLVVMGIALLQETVTTSIHGVLVLPYLSCYLVLRLARTHLIFEGLQVQVFWVLALTVLEKLFERGMLPHGTTPPWWALVVEVALQALMVPILFSWFDRYLRESDA